MKPLNIFTIPALIISFAAMALFNNISHFKKEFYLQENKITESDFKALWKQIDSLERTGLPRSALKIVDSVFAISVAEKNADQIIKSLIFKLKFEYSFEGNYYSKRIVQFENELKNFSFPVTPLLHSMLGEMYWQYFQQNRYTYYNRSKTINYKQDDLNTWDLDKILEKSREHYLKSLENSQFLQKSPLESTYKEIILRPSDNPVKLPTLYDFLIYRAIEFFRSGESSINQPVEQFNMENEKLMLPAKQFANFSFNTPDTLDHKYLVVKLYQDLISFHLPDNNPEALVDIDLLRLKYIYDYSRVPDLKNRYVKILEKLKEQYKSYETIVPLTESYLAEALYLRAEEYTENNEETYAGDYKKAMVICNKVIRNGKNRFAADNCKAIVSLITQKNLEITAEKIVIPGDAFPVSIKYRNTDSVYIKVFLSNFPQMDTIITRGNQYSRYTRYRNYNEYLVDTFLSFKPFMEMAIRIPAADDYRNHITELAMPGLPAGNYVMLFSNNSKFSYKNNAVVYQFISASDISFINRTNSKGEVEYYLFHRKTGNPLENVRVSAITSHYDYRTRTNILKEYGSYLSNIEGYFKIIPDEKGAHIMLTLIYNSDSLLTRDFGRRDSRFQYINRNSGLYFSHTRTYFFTDRSIYRPGQTLYFKGIMLETDEKKSNRIIAGRTSTVGFYDANQQLVSSVTVTTNEFGTFSGSFVVPQGKRNGMMSVRNQNGSKYFSVEEYKRPKFEVVFNEIKGSYKIKEKVTINGFAKAFSGAGIDNAEVKYRVIRNMQWRPWSYYYRNMPAHETQIVNGTIKSNEKGEFDITFTALPDYSIPAKSKPVYRYTVTADVTDINGETHSASKSVSVGYNALIISANLPEWLDKKENHKFTVTTANPEGTFEPAKGTIAVYKLTNPSRAYRERLWDKPDKFIYSEETFHKLLPYDQYQEENNFATWPKEQTMLKTTFNTAESNELLLNNLKTWPSGKYLVEITSLDKFGEPVEESLYFTLYSKDDKSMPYPAADLFALLKNSAEPGDKVQLVSGTAAGKNFILFELEQDQTLFEKKWVMPDNEMNILEIPIKEDYRGNVHINYVFVKYGRIHNHTETIRVPYTNKQLDIAFETFRDRLQPGEDEEWRIKISAKNGDKVAAEMVATLYDASLDEFDANSFDFNINKFWYPKMKWKVPFGFETGNGNLVSNEWNTFIAWSERQYPILNWYGFNYHYRPIFSTYYEIPEIKHGSIVVVSSKPSNSLEVSGTVKDADGNPLPGANITVVGTKSGTVADADGKFTLLCDEKEAVLQISFIGYLKESITVKGITVLDIRLTEDIHQLDELIVVGYGSMKKSDVTGSVSMMVSEKIEFAEEEMPMFFMEAESEIVIKRMEGISVFDSIQKSTHKELSQVKARTNFNETAFFFPNLKTNEKGEVIIQFKVPESLTKWKMLGFAHTHDLKYGHVQNELVTSKSLMVIPNLPRFFREEDKMVLSAKITNISEKKLSGSAQLALFDGLSMNPADDLMKNKTPIKEYTAEAGQSTVVSWEIEIPEGMQAITCRVVATAGNFSDGEEITVPVMSNRILVTETLPVWVKSGETRTFTLDKLVNNQSTTLKHERLTFEFTANPAWYAIQALPYMMEYPYECMEQTFSRFYSNSIASHIVNSAPKIKQVFDSWKNEKDAPALLSKLEQNQELKQILLEETPWVLQAKNESERKKRVALLFDLNRMSDELGRAVEKLKKGQYPSGGWPWFEGGHESRWITQHIVAGYGHLDKLGVTTIRKDREVFGMLRNAIRYIDQQALEEYRYIKHHQKDSDLSKNHLSYMAIHYLYCRSFFKDIALPPDAIEAVHFFKQQTETYWLKQSRYLQGMIALALYRDGRDKIPLQIIASLREFASHSDEFGMYWNERWGYFWYQAPVETQALMIELFGEVAKDTTAVDDMKLWLLKQKQTTDWKTTKATTEACYALLLQGTEWLAVENKTEIEIGSIKLNIKEMPEIKTEAGTGYFKKTWTGGEINNDMGKVTLSKKDPGVSWGGLYWQYFEKIEKITSHETPLKLNKKLFREIVNEKGRAIEPVEADTKLVIGDKVIVRIELRTDRPMEYVHMKDMRAACFEPVNVISRFKWQDRLGYYESTKDASVNFFFDWVPAGTYVFEYPLWVTHEGDFSNGITTIQCMYAPEFSAHSEGIRVTVESK
ncbi:MAG: carboxypeptidase-like regulatory domain-containing protein [Bacteroidales bacterium]|nr:carboxypeptidase-like regulatory domain-containing protein [Bacteroidales bacterium]